MRVYTVCSGIRANAHSANVQNQRYPYGRIHVNRGGRCGTSKIQTCAKVPKRFEILGLLCPRSGTLVDLGPCMSFFPWDSGNPGPQNCVMSQDPGNSGSQDFDMQ